MGLRDSFHVIPPLPFFLPLALPGQCPSEDQGCDVEMTGLPDGDM